MDDRTTSLIGGLLSLGVAGLVLFGSLVPGVELPAAAYALVGIGLFAGVYLVGRSRPGGSI